MMLTFNFNQPVPVTYYTTSPDDDSYHKEVTWKTSLTIPHGLDLYVHFNREANSTISNNNGEKFNIYDYNGAGDYCQSCYDYTFDCIFEPKNVITDEKGKIKRLIMSSGHSYHYEFELE